MTTVLMISGSVRRGSVNAAVLATAATLLPPGASAVVHDGPGTLPHFNPDLDEDPLPPPVVALRRAIAEADALFFSTPEYAGALPGTLKNLLEWTVGGVETTDKPYGWFNPSTMPGGAAASYETLDIVLRYTGARRVDAACARHPVPRSAIANGLLTDGTARVTLSTCLRHLV